MCKHHPFWHHERFLLLVCSRIMQPSPLELLGRHVAGVGPFQSEVLALFCKSVFNDH